jgi:hypothetical protein
MALVRWKWVDYLNVELYEHNLMRQFETPAQTETPIGYDSDEEVFFDRLNHRNLERFMEFIEVMRYRMAEQRRYQQQEQQRLAYQIYYNAYGTPYPPPAYVPIIR